MSRGMKVATTTAMLVALAVLALAAVVRADDPTRDAYAAQVDPICQANADANNQILAGVRGKVNQGKYGVASKQFGKAAGAFKSAIGQISAVPQPPADAPRLAHWIQILQKIQTGLKNISTDLKKGDRYQAKVVTVQLQGMANSANNVSNPFGFSSCHLSPSQFT